jgi:16S rRNA pseudouridine516 synthase
VAERLDHFLAHHGHGTRSEVKTLVRRGKVSINGDVCRDPGRHLDLDNERIEVDGDEVVVGPSEATLILHKPVGYACSHDPREAPLIEALYPETYANLCPEPAGRLDRMTSGLLIVTTAGDLIHRLTNPRKKLAKRYQIAYTGQLSSHAVERCVKGIDLEGDPRPTLPSRLVLLDADSDGVSRAILTLHEGRYHQVRRMIAALGGEVVRLHRDRIGGLDLPDDLPPGSIREVTAREMELLTQEDTRSEQADADPVEAKQVKSVKSVKVEKLSPDAETTPIPQVIEPGEWQQMSLGEQVRLGRRPR